MKMRLIPVAILALVGSMFLAAQQSTDDGHRRRGPRFDQAQQALNLTSEQLTALQENNRALMQATREILSEVRETRQALQAELRLDTPNPSIVGQHTVALQQVQRDVKAKRDEFHASALAILDDAQKAKLAEIEEALQMISVASQARGLNLLTAPDRGDGAGFTRGGFGGFSGGFSRHGGSRGFHGPGR